MVNQQKVCVVSGGSKGLGLSLCQALLQQGYQVSTFSRSRSSAIQQLEQQYPEQFMWMAVDIANRAQLVEFVKQTKKQL